MKKLLSFILAFAMVFSLMSAFSAALYFTSPTSFAAGDYDMGEGYYGEWYYNWSQNWDYEYYIGYLQYNGHEQTVTIPTELNGIPLKELYVGTLSRINAAVIIPNNLIITTSDYFSNYIENYLKGITVNNDNPQYHTEGNCLIETATKTLILGCSDSVIPSDGSVASIGANAFNGCADLKNITIPNSVTSIGEGAFANCTGLTSVTIPDSVTSIGSSAFYGCTGLTSVTIPDSITSIGDYAFRGCTGLTSITIHDSVTSIGGSAFSGCAGLTSVTIGNGVTSIGMEAFSDCKSLTSITIPDSVTSIGYSAFHNCVNLENVYGCENLTSLGSDAIRNTKIMNNDIVYLGSLLYRVKNVTGSFTVKNGTKQICYQAFSNLTGLTSITIPDSVTSIGVEAFYGCTGLTSVTIGSGVTSIGEEAFSGCTGLTSVTIPDSVTSIGNNAFHGCNNLSEISLPYTINPDNPVSSYFHNLFNRYGSALPLSLKTVHITSGIIPDGAFSNGCYEITTITIGSGVTSIGNSAFRDCTSLSNLTVAEDNPYYHVSGNCLIETKSKTLVAGFANSVIPSDGSVKVIGQSAFYRCAGLTGIVIPDSVKRIRSDAFYGCENLAEITLGKNVSFIDQSAFGNCPALATVNYLGTEDEWYETDVAEYNDPLYRADVVCDYSFPVVPVIDLTGDGELNDSDVLYLLYHVFFPNTFPLSQNCDFTGDGAVTDSDVIYLLYHVYFPEDYPIALPDGKKRA